METPVCNLCGDNRITRVFRNAALDMSRCHSCGLIYTAPIRFPRVESLTRYNDRYFTDEYLPSFGVRDGHVDLEGFDERYRRTLGHCRRHRALGTLLEVGCGAGFFLKAAERDGWTVTGLEVMTAGVTFARQTLGLEVLEGAIEDVQLPDAGYDIVALFEVIEHLSDPLAVLERLRPLLRPGGALVMSTPNIESLSRYALGNEWAVLSPAEHLYFFSERTLRQLLQKAGYTNVWYDRHYAGEGRYETVLPTHSFTPQSKRAQRYKRLVDWLSPWVIRRVVQAGGWADGLHVFAQRPEGT